MNIFVGNLASDVNEEDLQKSFESFGKVSSVKIIRDMFTQDSKGFGFVEMPSKEEAQAAIKGLIGFQLKGKPIAVNEARPPRDKKRSFRNNKGRRY